MFRRFYRKLPVFNFIISTSALTFQIAVLHPCHGKITNQIDEINKNLLNPTMALDYVLSESIDIIVKKKT